MMTFVGRRCLASIQSRRLVHVDSFSLIEDRLNELRNNLRTLPTTDPGSTSASFNQSALTLVQKAISSNLVCLVGITRSQSSPERGIARTVQSIEASCRLPSTVISRIRTDIEACLSRTIDPKVWLSDELVRPIILPDSRIVCRAVTFFRSGADFEPDTYVWVGFSDDQDTKSRDLAGISRAIEILDAEIVYRDALQQARKMNDASQANTKSAALFVARIAHDMQSPISSIDSLLKLIPSAQSAAEVAELLDMGRQSCDFVRQLSSQLVHAADPTGKSVHGERGNSCLVGVLRDLIQTYRTTSGTDLHLDLGAVTDKEVFVGLSAVNLRRVFENLISNAIKYGQKKSVTVKLSLDSTNILVEFIDRGDGLSSSDIERVLGPFERASVTTAGFGVGLHSVDQLLKTVNGGISISSTRGSGTTVSIRLPLVRVADSAPGKQVRTPSLLGIECKQLTILDDNHELGESLVRVLKSKGIFARAFTDPDKALQSIVQHGTDKVLTDYQMPLISAQAFIHKVLALDPEINLAVMSGELSDEAAYDLAAIGAKEIFAKPIDIDHLVTWVTQSKDSALAKAA